MPRKNQEPIKKKRRLNPPEDIHLQEEKENPPSTLCLFSLFSELPLVSRRSIISPPRFIEEAHWMPSHPYAIEAYVGDDNDAVAILPYLPCPSYADLDIALVGENYRAIQFVFGNEQKTDNNRYQIGITAFNDLYLHYFSISCPNYHAFQQLTNFLDRHQIQPIEDYLAYEEKRVFYFNNIEPNHFRLLKNYLAKVGQPLKMDDPIFEHDAFKSERFNYIKTHLFQNDKLHHNSPASLRFG